MGFAEFGGVEEHAGGGRGRSKRGKRSRGAGNGEDRDDGLVITKKEVRVAEHVTGVQEMQMGAREQGIVSDGEGEAGG